MKYDWENLDHMPSDDDLINKIYRIKLTAKGNDGSSVVDILENLGYGGRYKYTSTRKDVVSAFSNPSDRHVRTTTETHKFNLDYVKHLIKSSLEGKFQNTTQYLSFENFRKSRLRGYDIVAPKKYSKGCISNLENSIRKMF